MKKKLITAALVAASLMLAGVTTAADAPRPPDNPAFDQSIRDLIAQFRERRQDVLQSLQQLRERLANATEEERKAIMEEFRQRVRERNQAELELRKELRQRRLEMLRERRREHAGTSD